MQDDLVAGVERDIDPAGRRVEQAGVAATGSPDRLADRQPAGPRPGQTDALGKGGQGTPGKVADPAAPGGVLRPGRDGQGDRGVADARGQVVVHHGPGSIRHEVREERQGRLEAAGLEDDRAVRRGRRRRHLTGRDLDLVAGREADPDRAARRRIAGERPDREGRQRIADAHLSIGRPARIDDVEDQSVGRRLAAVDARAEVEAQVRERRRGLGQRRLRGARTGPAEPGRRCARQHRQEGVIEVEALGLRV